MKIQTKLLSATLLACLLVATIIFCTSRKAGVAVAELHAPVNPAQTTGAVAPLPSKPTGGASRMITDASADQVAPDGALPGSRSRLAAPLQDTVAAHAKATLTIGAQQISLEPNQIGAFPRQPVQLGQKVAIQVAYPEGAPGDLVVAAMMDGGQFDNREPVLPLHLDAARQVSFNYTVSQETGIFRVTLRKGQDVKLVQFWAGEEPQLIGSR